MHEQSTALERLRTAFLKLFHVEVPSADTDLLDSGILDSLQLVELLMQIEKDFGLRLAIESIELEDLRTLGRLARLVAAAAHPARGAQPPIRNEA